MGLFKQIQSEGVGAGSLNMRRATRYAANNISVPLGRVIDVSATGMKLQCPRKQAPAVGAIERFVLSNGSQRLVVKGQIVRARKPRWPTAPCDVGVQFLETTASVRTALEQLGKYGFIQGGKHATGFKSAGTATTGAAAPDESRNAAHRVAEVRADLEVGDLYALLGVARDASDDDIRAAYRTRARASHPDASDDPNAEQVFADLAKAYKVLIDPAMRARYDSLLSGNGPAAAHDECAAA